MQLSGALRVLSAAMLAIQPACSSAGESLAGPRPAASVVVTVDAAARHQTMFGFGSWHLPMAWGPLGDVLGPVLRARAMDAVYGQVQLTTGNLSSHLYENGKLGGNVGVVHEAPSYGRATENDNADPYVMNAAGFDWTPSDQERQYLVDLARPWGFVDFYPQLTINVVWSDPWLAAIRASDYNHYLDEAAEHVLAGLQRWRDAYGIVQPYVMLFNEPTSGNRELASSDPQEIVELIKRVGQRLAASGFANVKFVVPCETDLSTSLSVTRAILADPLARSYVGVIGYHPYGSAYQTVEGTLSTAGAGKPDAREVALRNQLRDLAARYGIPVWMTEVSEGGDPRAYDTFLGRAISFRDEMLYADAAAVFGMYNISDRVSYRLHFGNDNLYGTEQSMVIVDQEGQTVTITATGHAIGHYARWVKKGAVRVDARSDDAMLLPIAFRDDGRGRLVVVLINAAAAPRAVRIAPAGVRIGGAVQAELSTAAAYWQPRTGLAVGADGSVSVDLPARSVVSLSVPIVQ